MITTSKNLIKPYSEISEDKIHLLFEQNILRIKKNLQNYDFFFGANSNYLFHKEPSIYILFASKHKC